MIANPCPYQECLPTIFKQSRRTTQDNTQTQQCIWGQFCDRSLSIYHDKIRMHL